MSELDPDVRAFLERTRRAGTPSPSERERVRRRVLAVGAATTVAAGAPTAAALTSSGIAKIVVSTVVASIAVGAPVAYSVLSAPVLRDRTHTTAPARERSTDARSAARAPAVREQVVAPEEPPAPTLQRTPPGEPEVSARPASTSPGDRAARRVESPAESRQRAAAGDVPSDEEPDVVPGEPVLVDDTLLEETSLLARSVRAINDGAFDEARALLDEHTTRFPDSQLRREREATAARLASEAR